MSGKNPQAVNGKDNGKAVTPTAETKTANTNSAPGATPAPKAQTTQPPKEIPEAKRTPKTISEIIAKSEKLNQLISGLKKLDEAYKELDSIVVGNPKVKNKLVIENISGDDFETSNDALIEDTVNYLKERIENRIDVMSKELADLESQ